MRRKKHMDSRGAFLASVAAGGPSDSATLAAALGTDWAKLEPAFRRWLAGLAIAR